MKVKKQERTWHGQRRTVWAIDSREDGQRIAVVSTVSRADCLSKYRKKLKEIKAARAEEQARREGRRTLERELREWYEREKTGGTGATVTSDRAQLEQVCKALGRKQIREITRETITAWIKGMEKDGLAVSTRRRRFFLLRQFFRAWYLDDPGKDPTRGIKTPAERAREKAPPEVLTDEEMERLTAYLLAPGTLHGEALAVLLWQALRAGELMGLRAEDLEGGRLRIRRQITWSKAPGQPGQWKVSSPKYGSSRIMPVMEPVRERLEAAAKRAEAEKLPYIYTGKDLPHLTPHSLRIALTHALTACGIRYIRVHDLRHSGISYLIRHGVPVEAVSKWAGHASITVTLGVYYQMIPAQITAAEQQAQKIFESLKP